MLSCLVSFLECSVTIRAANLYSRVDECLGIDPAVEFGGVAEPFHQSFRSSTYLTYAAVPLPRGTLYRRVPTPVRRRCRPDFAEIVLQSLHGWIGGMNLAYREHLFAPIRRVALFELTFVLADAHAIRHTQLGHALTGVSVQALPHLFLVLCTYL